MSDIDDRLTEYCLHGGLYNPELMQHEKVRDLLIDCRSEIARLRLAIRRLAEQDATLSVCEGNVTVTTDATLTDAEREAVNNAAYLCGATAGLANEQANATAWATCAATLRGLLERLK